MRHVNNEKQVREWQEKQKERAAEQAAAKEEAKLRRPQYTFDDTTYSKQVESVREAVGGSVAAGLQAAKKAKAAEAANMAGALKKKRKPLPFGAGHAAGAAEGDAELDLDFFRTKKPRQPAATAPPAAAPRATTATAGNEVLSVPLPMPYMPPTASAPTSAAGSGDASAASAAAKDSASGDREPIDLQRYDSAAAMLSACGPVTVHVMRPRCCARGNTVAPLFPPAWWALCSSLPIYSKFACFVSRTTSSSSFLDLGSSAVGLRCGCRFYACYGSCMLI
eukprot:SAG31_NODE_5459_length_2524_cov_2.828041_2_plen_279_part_00